MNSWRMMLPVKPKKMIEIKNWLASEKDYSKGADLYKTHGSSTFYKNLFAAGKTAYSKNKLLDELKKLCPAEQKVEKVEKVELVEIPVQPSAQAAKDFPKYLALNDRVSALYAQANRAKFQLDNNNNSHVLLKIALMLKKIKRAIIDSYELKNYYDEHGAFPISAERQTAKDVKDKPKTLQLLLQSNAKAKARLKSDKCKNTEKTKELIAANTAMINDLRIEIGRVNK
jgi:hypothetical protein